MTLRVGITAVPLDAAGVEFVRQAERLGVDSVWAPGVLGRRRVHPAGATSRPTRADPAGDRHRPARRPHPGDAGDVRDVDAGAVAGPVRARHRHQRTAGDGGLARRPVRPAGHRTRETIEIIRTITAGERLAPRRRGVPGCRSRAARGAASGRCCRRPTCRSTSPRSDRPTCA